MNSKKLTAIVLSLIMVLAIALVGCGQNTAASTTETEKPETQVEEQTDNETKEEPEGEPEQTESVNEEEPVSDRPAFAQIDWSKYCISDKEMTFLGKPGDEITLDDVLEAYPEGWACLRENAFTGVTKDNIYNVEDYLRLVDKEGRDDLLFSLTDDLRMFKDSQNCIAIDFPMFGEDILLSDALASDCWAVSVYACTPITASLQPIDIEVAAESLGGGGVDPSYHAKMLTEFMDKYGAPTGLLYSKEVGEFFGPDTGNPYAGTKYNTAYILYWDRGSYVVAISMEERVDRDGFWVSFVDSEGLFYTKSAWDNIVACETNPNNSFYPGWELVPFEDFGALYEAANEIANYPRQ